MTRVRRLICFGLILALLTGPIVLAYPETEALEQEAATEGYYIEAVAEETSDLAYLEAMLTAARDGSAAALARGAEAETARNQKIQVGAIDAAETAFFTTADAPAQIAVAIADYLVALGITELGGAPIQFRIVASSKNLREGPERDYERVGSFAHGTIVTSLGRSANGWLKVTDGEIAGWGTAIHLAPVDGSPAPIWIDPPNSSRPGGALVPEVVDPIDHTQDDLFWLALTIQIEAGSDWLCDEHQLMVGNVVLNRVAHYRFPPTTIHGIVHQRGQYPWAANRVRVPISDRAWANAQRLLDGERVAPPNVVFQSQARQGDGTFATFHCTILGTTHFFGYLGSLD